MHVVSNEFERHMSRDAATPNVGARDGSGRSNNAEVVRTSSKSDFSRRTLAGNHFSSSSPFAKLASTHGLSVAGDALLTIALAGSIFFSSADPDAARGKVAVSLILTMAPFAVVAPFLGPLLDRYAGGRKLMVFVSLVARAVLCLLMADVINDENVVLYPLVFSALVLSKGYQVSRSSLVPSAVKSEDDLVKANSKLALIAGIFGFLALIPGAIVQWAFGADWTLRLAAIVYLFGCVLSVRIVQRPIASAAALEEPAPVRSTAVVTAAVAMGSTRFLIGFLTFLVAFNFRGDGSASGTVAVGFALVVSAIGGLVGNYATPRFLAEMPRERVIEWTIIAIGVASFIGALVESTVTAIISVFIISLAAAGTRLSFDALVQRDAPDSKRASFFARFEAAFQVAWVFGAITTVVIHFSIAFGFVVQAVVAGATVAIYVFGRRRVERLAAQGHNLEATLEGAYPEIAHVRKSIHAGVNKFFVERRAYRASQAKARLEARRVWGDNVAQPELPLEALPREPLFGTAAPSQPASSSTPPTEPHIFNELQTSFDELGDGETGAEKPSPYPSPPTPPIATQPKQTPRNPNAQTELFDE